MFRGKMLAMLKAAHAEGRLEFFGPHAALADKAAFKSYLEPLYDTQWHVYAKRPFAGPEQVLAYLARYTHRVAISNKRLIGMDEKGVTFTFKDYRIEGPGRYKTMTVAPGEFIRRFMLHVLPKGFHRIRHYGLLATSRTKAATLERARKLIAAAAPPTSAPTTKQEPISWKEWSETRREIRRLCSPKRARVSLTLSQPTKQTMQARAALPQSADMSGDAGTVADCGRAKVGFCMGEMAALCVSALALP
jgi:hypothetical protein